MVFICPVLSWQLTVPVEALCSDRGSLTLMSIYDIIDFNSSKEIPQL